MIEQQGLLDRILNNKAEAEKVEELDELEVEETEEGVLDELPQSEPKIETEKIKPKNLGLKCDCVYTPGSPICKSCVIFVAYQQNKIKDK